MNDSAAETLKPVANLTHHPRLAPARVYGVEQRRRRQALVRPDRLHRSRSQGRARCRGPFEVLMRSPVGEEHWARGVVEGGLPVRAAGHRLHRRGANGRALFRAFTEVDFSDDARRDDAST